MAHSRRDFLKGTISALTFSMVGPKLLFNSSGNAFARTNATSSNRVLVVIEFDGGNDGLNTVIPYTDSNYYSLRPTLAVPESSVLKVDEKMGFNPVMTKFKGLYDQGRIAVVQNVGYPDPDLSHFRSRAILQRADPTTQESFEQSGWLGKYADLYLAKNKNPLSVINFGTSVPKSLIGQDLIPSSILDFSLYQFNTDASYPADRNNQINALKKANGVMSNDAKFLFIETASLDTIDSSDVLQNGIKAYQPTIQYPADGLGRQLQMAAQIVAGNLGATIIHILIGGFDTHSAQKDDQEDNLTSISEGFDAFYRDITQLNKANDVLVLGFSEFGRRPKENGSEGTDHGTGGPMFIMGNAVKGGLYGSSPSLTDLDKAGNVKFDIDFRSVYSTILSDWLQVDAKTVLGNSFENVGFLNK